MISVKHCYALHESYWENFLFSVDYPMEVYRGPQRFQNLIHVMHELSEPGENSMKNNFITADSLHTSFEGVQTF